MDLEERLRSHVYTLAGDIGERNVFKPDALKAAEEYIRKEWENMGYRVEEQVYRERGVDCANLAVDLKGSEYPGKIILLGAHYDSVAGSPGADDNGSAVAALLEASRLLKGSSPSVSFRFVAFVNEEPPFFNTSRQGSRVYVKEARRRGEDIEGAVILEMVGYFSNEKGSQDYPPLLGFFYPDRGDFLAMVSNIGSARWLGRFAEAFRGSGDFPVEKLAVFTPLAPGAAWSDHLSFWKYGYKALMVTDTAFYRNPHYHTAGDTPEKLDYEKMADFTRNLVGALKKLAGDGGSSE